MFLSTEAAKHIEILGMSSKFWIVMIVLALFITAILTSSYNEDKTPRSVKPQMPGVE